MQHYIVKTERERLTRIARKTVELMPSATSYSPFSLGLVKLCSLPDPNILKQRRWALLSIHSISMYLTGSLRDYRRGAQGAAYLPNMVLGCAVKMEGSTTKRVLSTIRVTRSEVRMLRLPTGALAPPSFGFS